MNRCNPIQAGIARLYHYEKFRPEWLTTTLRDQKVHCSNPANLNDPWDCRPWFDDRSITEDPEKLEAMLATFRGMAPTDLVNHPMRKVFEDRIRNNPDELKKFLAGFSQSIQREIGKRRIYCLTPDPCSTLMWSHYAENHRGICLEFHLGNVLFLKAWKVTYLADYPICIPQDMHGFAEEAILTKSTDWEYAQEFRLVGSPSYSDNHPLKPDGDYLRLPPRCLQSVVLGCEGDYDAVKQVVDKHMPMLPIKRIIRVPNHYKLQIVSSVPDPPRKLAIHLRE